MAMLLYYLLAQLRIASSPVRQQALLQAILDSLARTPGLGRVEAQLMMLNSPLTAVPRFPFKNYPREFLTSLAGPSGRLPERPQPGISITRWTEALHDRTASLIASAYQGHIDSEINDQYRTPGARAASSPTSCSIPAAERFSAPLPTPRSTLRPSSYAAFR